MNRQAHEDTFPSQIPRIYEDQRRTRLLHMLCHPDQYRDPLDYLECHMVDRNSDDHDVLRNAELHYYLRTGHTIWATDYNLMTREWDEPNGVQFKLELVSDLT